MRDVFVVDAMLVSNWTFGFYLASLHLSVLFLHRTSQVLHHVILAEPHLGVLAECHMDGTVVLASECEPATVYTYKIR